MNSNLACNFILPVILCGGSGSRLWPLSREKHPKQLLSLTESNTLLQTTVTRLSDFVGSLAVADNPLVISNEEYRFIVAEQLREVGYENPHLVLEPFGRNTAPALTLAAIVALSNEGEDPLLLVMPADHIIADKTTFHRAVEEGIQQALQGAIVTFGIVPNKPETGYGYIQLGEALDNSKLCKIAAFVEKPNQETAEKYLNDKKHLWNSGIFLMKASTWMKAIQHFNPAIANSCKEAYAQGKQDGDFIRIDRDAFQVCPADSIDYAVMEHLNKTPELNITACVMPLNAGWSDLGAWDSVWQASLKDQSSNATQGDVVLHDTHNSLILSQHRLVTCLGVNNLVVVETADAVLVASKDKTQEIKKIVAHLKIANRPHTEDHRKVNRPWGSYDSLDSGERFQVKRIIVKPGASLSLQRHSKRAEHWIVVKGSAEVTRAEEIFIVHENESTYIPLGTKHRLKNPGKTNLEMIEVQSGSYLGEDDIERFDDHYGRV